MCCKRNTRGFVNNPELGKTADDNIDVPLLGILFGNGSQFLNHSNTTVSCDKARFGCDVRGGTTDVEGTEGKLCTGFTDTLCGYNTDSLTLLHHPSGGEVTAVTLGTDTLL